LAKGQRYPSESQRTVDEQTGAAIRRVTSAPAIHHHPFFLIPAYDDAMRRLVFVSHRAGSPQVFAEDRGTGELVQLTDRDDLAEWSVHPSHDGQYVYFTAGTGAWRVNTETYKEEQLADFGQVAMREKGMVGAAMGTTALSRCDRWWAVKFNVGDEACLAIIDTVTAQWEIVLRRDTIAHMQFCPDDPDLLFYAGPLTDRVWAINRDGTDNRRLYQRKPGEWITHESWIPGTGELAFVDWPHGIRCVQVDTGEARRVTSFNAWHAVCNRDGTLMAADTNFPDIGLQIFNPHDGRGEPLTLCYPEASSIGEHWNGPFPYENGPIKVYAPQHTHPHPSFSPDGQVVVFTSDRTGYAQVYEAELPTELVESKRERNSE
jgi:oligogalacturonide lyase